MDCRRTTWKEKGRLLQNTEFLFRARHQRTREWQVGSQGQMREGPHHRLDMEGLGFDIDSFVSNFHTEIRPITSYAALRPIIDGAYCAGSGI